MLKSNILKSKTTLKNIGLATVVSMMLFSCTEESKRGNKADTTKESKKEEKKNSNLFEISGKVFSIPSPIQTAFMLKNTGAAYSSELLNSTASVASYSTTDRKALNLGIFGADMGYATIYDQTQDAISYMAVTKRLSSELGITNIFNEDMLTRFEANLGDQDSLLALVSDAFKSVDSYLKTNKQEDISVMILAGGWIETLHFATNLAKTNDDPAIKNRIGEQKITIKNLINLLLPYQEKPAIATVMNKLNELKDIYNGIEFKYTFKEPTTDPETKTTTINSVLEVSMTAEQLQEITIKVEEIRNSVIK
ncbi:MAG: hypothetical protein JKY48_12855 [Flavobacteriales bacterium]|nr:hypothetical protein [Flavobacteriales bacterium]